MPYIKEEIRQDLSGGQIPNTPGELTYKIQQVLAEYIEHWGENYNTFAECLGAIEGLKADFIRRKVEPYEKRKQKENGDVW